MADVKRTDEDSARFEVLYREHFRRVLRYALARVGPEQAKDAVADTFVIAWRRLADVPSEPAPWLFGVTRRVIAGQLRADARRDALGTRLAVVHTGEGSARDVAVGVVEREVVLAAFARLRERDREALRLVAWDGLSSSEAAQVLAVSRPTFAVRLHRARQRFAAEIAKAELAVPSPTQDAVVIPHAIPASQAKEAR
jgi:RNA polymerase sigma-70 factor, ECF subfamily